MIIKVSELQKLLTAIEKQNISITELIERIGNGKEIFEPKWIEKDSIIRFSVTSDGTTGEEWAEGRLKSKGFWANDYAESTLKSRDFRPTNGIIYKVAVLKGEIFSNDNNRITKNIRKKAKSLEFFTPNPEVACLIREKFSDKELKAMGLYWIAVMHEPIEGFDGTPGLFIVGRGGIGSWLRTRFDSPNSKWERGGGFAFVISQVSVFKP